MSKKKKKKKNLENQKFTPVEKNLKNLMRNAEPEREDCGHAVYGNWCAVCVKGRCVAKHLQVELLRKKRKNEQSHHCLHRKTPITFSILIRRDDGQSQTKVTCCERKDSIPIFCRLENHLKDE